MSAVLIGQAVVVAMMLLIALAVPALSRSEVPFGVQVPPNHRDAPVIATARRRYRWTVLGGGGLLAVVVFVVLAVTGRPSLTVVAIVAVLAAMVVGYVRAHRVIAETKRREDWYAGLRQAVAVDTSLRTDPPRVPWLWALPAVVVLAATVIVGIVRYPHLPDQLAVHYNGAGEVDRTAGKTFGSAFLAVFFQLGLTILILALVPVISRVRAELDPAAPERDAQRHRRFVAGMARGLMVLAFCLNLTMGAVSFAVWFGAGANRWLPALLLLPTLAGIAAIAVPALRDRKAGEGAHGDGPVARDDDKHWKAGLFYYNPDDPAVFVRRRFGVGWTINHGNPRGWLALGAMIAVVVLLVVVSTTTAHASSRLPATDREVQFTVDGVTAYGTVHVPAHRPGQRLPAVLLLPGSGPTDRDGDQPPKFTPHTLALMADRLGDDGVLTLRFDKYGSGRTQTNDLGTSDPGGLDLDAFVRQAVGAFGLLAAQPEADRRHLGIAGHSEGGMTATLVALQTHPRVVAMIAPQDERLLDLLRRQLDAQFDTAVRLGQLTPAQAATNKQALAKAIDDFRAGRPVDTSGLLPQVKALMDGLFGPLNARFVRSDDAIYPPEVAAMLPRSTKVVLTCGSADVQVPCDTIGPLAAATRHAGGPGLLVLPVDHDLHTPGTDPNAQVLAPSVDHTLDLFAHLVR
ncbi:DUF1648 domain-containing protein [Labedaea rhizosphaerae]|uniref:Putative membrane protein n=1 Tax=Labedaea rhizosphaerae TaxID=598644 RepID=A0A4V3CZB6_LABRH|nr:DUF1648 domain-containing protein [Labedaea rhizosphaerae]TDP97418.1 putative membrane protein [Labedaea rhizosphaerae]